MPFRRAVRVRSLGMALGLKLGLAGVFGAVVPAGAAGDVVLPVDPVVAFLEERVKADPDDSVAWNRLGGHLLARLREGGEPALAARAQRAAEESLRAVPAAQNPAGVVLRGEAALAAHRFAAARDDGAFLVREFPHRTEGWRILGDAEFELGAIDAAERAWAELARLEPKEPATEIRGARLAQARGKNAEAARRLRAAQVAAEKAGGPGSADLVAWCWVRRGYLDFCAGRTAAAETAYRAALAARPGWFAAEDHLAEALAARGDFDGALALYRPLAERLRRPEIWQALGDVLVAAGRATEAAGWHERALAGYLAEASAGNAHYFHHLAGFYAEVRCEPAEAVRWARRDLELRQSAAAWDALGRALYQSRDYAGAVEAQEKALAGEARDAHLLYNAALIFDAAGKPDRAAVYLRAAAAANPRFRGFHVHR